MTWYPLKCFKCGKTCGKISDKFEGKIVNILCPSCTMSDPLQELLDEFGFEHPDNIRVKLVRDFGSTGPLLKDVREAIEGK